MMFDQTFNDLYNAKAILEADVSAAVDAFLANPATNHYAVNDRSSQRKKPCDP